MSKVKNNREKEKSRKKRNKLYPDFDWSSLIYVIKLQLEVMYKIQFEQGHCLHPESHRRAIRTCIYICNRLLDTQTNDDRYDRITVKLTHRTEELPDGCMRWINTSSQSDIRLFRYQYELMNKIIESEKNLLFKLMSKYIFSWWD